MNNRSFVFYSVKETHQIAEAQEEKNRSLRSAFGISEYFVEGSSMDPNRKNREIAAKEAAESKKKTVYNIVRTPSPEAVAEEGEDEPIAADPVVEKAKKSSKKNKKDKEE